MLDRVARGWCAGREGRQVPAVLIVDRYLAVVEPQPEAAFVYEPMVAPTELHEIDKIGAAAVGPMAHMVGVDPPPVRASREHAASVTSAQRSAE